MGYLLIVVEITPDVLTAVFALTGTLQSQRVCTTLPAEDSPTSHTTTRCKSLTSLSNLASDSLRQ